ncbi:TrkH family potassium uptake protein [Paracoccus aminophilus]|uniref:Trk system potassium uptake protein TrkH n=1 Tax=Paracoccus aminophilus JCM 7686 TaxID=1367847 RepID=S5XWB4_PARAH|nr:potassium transporter TrkG [Paracoccus aminophilus]AGT07690.1 Trk system potassium uptake protein TrkH [Paracoccus aminophilus JCM 7686]
MTILNRLPLLVILAGIGTALMLIPASYAAVLGQEKLADIFRMSALVLMVLIVVTGIASAAAPRGDTTRTLLLTVIGVMTILPALFAVPVMVALPDTGFFNAWWEMVSCLTTTGASLYSPDRVAEPLHLWRGIVGWMGGLFILASATAILAPLRIGGFELMSDAYGEDSRRQRAAARAGGRASGQSFSSSPAFNTELIDPVSRVLRIGKTVLPIYAVLTLALWIILLMLGDPGLVALMRAMGTISTSGITPLGAGTGQYSGLGGEVVVVLFMLPALSRRFWPGGGELRASELWRDDPELRLAALVVLGVAFVLFARHFIGAVEISRNQPEDLRSSFDSALVAGWGGLFNALSYLTTTGWNSGSWQGARSWSGLTSPGLILAGLAMMGGGVATAAGGVKLLRIYALLAHAEREMEKLIHPNSVAGGGRMARRLRTEGAFLAFIFFMLFAISIAVVVALISLQRIEFESATILAVSALTNTGPLAGAIPLTPTFEGSAGAAGAPWAGWAGLPDFTKAVLAGAMIVGRIETLAILALFNPEIWRR